MWSIIKWIILLAIVGGGILWFTGVKINGKTIQEHAKPVLETPMVKEGIHDIRQLVGEGLKTAGEAISEDVTDTERKQLDDLVKQEMMKGKPIEGMPGQQALPPQVQPQAMPQAAVPQQRPGAAEMLQQVQPAVPAAPAAAAPMPPSATPEPSMEQPRMIPAPMPPQAPAPVAPQGEAGY